MDYFFTKHDGGGKTDPPIKINYLQKAQPTLTLSCMSNIHPRLRLIKSKVEIRDTFLNHLYL